MTLNLYLTAEHVLPESCGWEVRQVGKHVGEFRGTFKHETTSNCLLAVMVPGPGNRVNIIWIQHGSKRSRVIFPDKLSKREMSRSILTIQSIIWTARLRHCCNGIQRA